MKITVLTENMAGGKLLAEHGLSYLVEHDNHKILFDAGHSDLFLRNGLILGIDVEKEVDIVVLSHGHWDHGDGLRYISDKKLICHPEVFMKRCRRGKRENIGLCLSREDIEKKFEVVTSESPLSISDNIIFLGGVPRNNDFESKITAFTDSSGNDDFVPDDSGLVIIDNNELVVISGCGHSGICNMVDHAINVTQVKKVKMVIGGFHLKHDNTETQKTIGYLKKHNIQRVYPSHCTELPALAAFYREFGFRQVKTGDIFDL